MHRTALALILGLILLAACSDRAPEGVALVGATVIDGSGGEPFRDAVVLVRGGQIESITPRANFDLPRRITEVDVSGRWIIPGLIDAHAHVERWALPRYVAFGVTSVRSVHGRLDSALALRDEINLGGTLAPRIWSAGAMIDGVPPTWPDALEAEDQRGGRRAIDTLVATGADFAKLYTRIDATRMRAILDEARTFGLPVSAHLGLTDALTATSLGLGAIEHMSGVPEAAARDPEKYYAAHRRNFFSGWTAFERGWAEVDSASLHRVARLLAERNTIIVPTMVLHDTYSRLDDPTIYTDDALSAVPRPEIERWNTAEMIQRAGWTAQDFEAFRASRPHQELFLRLFRAEGGVIAAGTDASNQQLVPGASEHREMELLVQAGLPPEAALAAATRNAARLLGVDSIGTLARGHAADLLVLSADPLRDIRNTRSIEYVMLRGTLYRADSLRAGW
jgi:imidazolonepropionase-like amidohydrolase